MPGMQGVELLRRARELSPDSVRILLTGYSDLASIVGSINEGEVYRFISKPWDNQDLQLIMSEAVEIGQHMIDRKSAAAQQAKMSAGIMVLDQRPGVFDALRRLLGHTHELVYAPTIDQALFQMEQREIGVLVADIDNEVDNYLILFNQLKQKYPQILVIVLTSASDSEMVIHLINEAQIYRFLNKPVNLGLMQQHLSGAIGRYAEYQSSPELLERHKVKGSEKAQASAFGRGLVERLKSLRNVFAMQAK
jgi:serine/threonine-protein kinase